MAHELDRIKSECRKRNIPAEDPNFIPAQTTIFYHQTPPFTFQWKRVTEITKKACFFNESEKFEIVPGKMGDEWLVSCLSVLHSVKNLFYRVVPIDQSIEKSFGIFKFHLWWFGEWQEVIVDDKLPTVNGKLVFLQPVDSSGGFWAPLLEKAIAKLHGSYEALKYGNRLDGFVDLFGGIVESIPMEVNNELLASMKLKNCLEVSCIITCIAVKNIIGKHRLPDGLNYNRSYIVCSLDKVETTVGSSVQLVRLKGTMRGQKPRKNTDYTFEWGLTSQSWNSVPSWEKDRLFRMLEEGEFWVSFSTFTQSFTNLECIHLDGKDVHHLSHCRKQWQGKMYEGQWKKGVTAGGCRNHESFYMNPQLLLTMSSSEELVICLSQHSAVDPKVIGFTIFKLNSASYPKFNGALSKDFFKTQVSLINSDYGNSRHISLKCVLEQGKYLLIPTTYDPGEESCFTIRTFGLSFRLLHLEIQTMLLINPFPLYNPKNISDGFETKKCQYEAVFMQLADEKKSINCFELLELLEACLPNDYIKGCANIDICRQVIALQDKTYVGRINFAQFKTFMINLKSWQGIFKIYTKEKSGVLRAEKLQDALYDVGFQLNGRIMNVLMNRYIRKDGTLRLSDYISAILHLTTAFDIFHENNFNQDNTINMKMSDWIQNAMLC